MTISFLRLDWEIYGVISDEFDEIKKPIATS